MTAMQLDGLLFWFPAFLFSTTLHEAAHAWAALRGGDPTAYHGGQVSLSPWPHIRREPIGMLVLPLLSSVLSGWAMGWASAPYDPAWADRHPRRAAWMAAAGPAANLLIAITAFLVLRLGLATGVFTPPDNLNMTQLVSAAQPGPFGAYDFAARMLSVFVMLNALLMVFNLLPLPPLDGATAIGVVLPEGLARMLRRGGSGFGLLGMLIAWRIFPHLVDPVVRVIVTLLHPNVRSAF
jgi:Zn-dependent protease